MTRPQLGLRANWSQFSLLVLVNAFVGAMVGLERTVLPLIAERDFGLASKSAALSFILTFGLVKATTNVVAGRLGDRFGRKRVLRALNLVIEPGETLVIIGQSGTGKSVLLKHIVGLLVPDRGSILVDGINVCKLSQRKLFELRMRVVEVKKAGEPPDPASRIILP